MTVMKAPVGADPVNLFDDLVRNLPLDEEVTRQLEREWVEQRLPAMPSDLEEFDREITNREARYEGFLMFLYVLRSRLTGGNLRDALIAARPACDPMDARGTRDSRGRVILMRSEKAEAFNADFPHPDDYPNGALSFEYRLAYRAAEIRMAQAKRICMTSCPLQRVCLASAVTEWSNEDATALAREHAQEIAKSRAKEVSEYEYLDVSTETVRGGWGPRGRDKIENTFHFWRRAYEQSAARLNHKPIRDGQIQRMPVEEISWPAYVFEPRRGNHLTVQQLRELDSLAMTIK
jgi:hypothetical protein